MRTKILKALSDEQLNEIATDYANNRQMTKYEEMSHREVANEIGRRIIEKTRFNHI